MFDLFGAFEGIIKEFYRFLLENLLGISTSTKLGGALHFFLFDVSLILLLLFSIIYLVYLIRSFIDPEKMKKLIEKSSGVKAHLLASLLGIVTPFCSCSSIPLFISFLEVGIPTGVVFSFLITSPMVNEAAFALLLTVFGLKVAVLYTVSGVVIGVLGGIIISKLKMERYLADYVQQKLGIASPEFQMVSGGDSCCSSSVVSKAEETCASSSGGCGCDGKSAFFTGSKHKFAINEAKSIVSSVWKYVLVGIAAGAFIHGWVPADSLGAYLGSGNKFGLLLAVIVGIPLYTDSVTIIPLAEVLIQKGVGLGTALAFMMSASALSLPEIILLKRVLKPKLIAVFVAITAGGIFTVGIMFNAIF